MPPPTAPRIRRPRPPNNLLPGETSKLRTRDRRPGAQHPFCVLLSGPRDAHPGDRRSGIRRIAHGARARARGPRRRHRRRSVGGSSRRRCRAGAAVRRVQRRRSRRAWARCCALTASRRSLHFAARIQVGESVVDPAPLLQGQPRREHRAPRERARRGSALGSSCRRRRRSTATRFTCPSTKITRRCPSTRTARRSSPSSGCSRRTGARTVCAGRRFATSTPRAPTPSAGLGERHDPETHLVPIVLDAALGRRDAVTVFGDDYDTPDGTCVRDYVHVLDLCDAHWLALEHLAVGRRGRRLQPRHRATVTRSVEVIDVARRVTGREHPRRARRTPRGRSSASRRVSAERAAKVLGWRRPAYVVGARSCATRGRASAALAVCASARVAAPWPRPCTMGRHRRAGVAFVRKLRAARAGSGPHLDPQRTGKRPAREHRAPAFVDGPSGDPPRERHRTPPPALLEAAPPRVARRDGAPPGRAGPVRLRRLDPLRAGRSTSSPRSARSSPCGVSLMKSQHAIDCARARVMEAPGAPASAPARSSDGWPTPSRRRSRRADRARPRAREVGNRIAT